MGGGGGGGMVGGVWGGADLLCNRHYSSWQAVV